jgi:hypothetical protein
VACRLLAVDNNILFAKFKQTRCSLNLLVFHIRFFFNPWTFRCPNLRCVCCYPIFPFKIVVRFKLDNIVIVKSNIFCSASTLGFVGSLCSGVPSLVSRATMWPRRNSAKKIAVHVSGLAHSAATIAALKPLLMCLWAWRSIRWPWTPVK